MTADAVTLLMSRGNPVNKEFTLQGDGSVAKRMVKNEGYFAAETKPIADLQAMASILHELAADSSLIMSLGLFKDAPDQVFYVEPIGKLARRLNVDPKDKDGWAGFHQIDGKWYVARAKVNMTFSS